VYDASDADVLLITGMRDAAPVASFGHLVPDSRLIEIRIQTSKEERQRRTGCSESGEQMTEMSAVGEDWRPTFTFDNTDAGDRAALNFAERYLLPLINGDLTNLAGMIRTIPDFPRSDIDMRHVLGLAQSPRGLALCSSMLESHYSSDWFRVSAIVACEAGGFIFASALASRVKVPLVLVREGGKLPPPIVSVSKPRSFISSTANTDNRRLEMERDAILSPGVVVVVDDVLASGATLCAVLQLLEQVGISAENINTMVVAEFPVHRGREVLRENGFGKVGVQSLLIFDGA
jgi:adenine phosphoribosyltransferase